MVFNETEQIQQLIGIYRQGFEEVLRIIIEKDAKGQWTRYHKDLMLGIQAVLRQLDEHADQWIAQTVWQSYSQATADTAAFLMGAGMAAAETPAFAQVHQRAIDVLAQNMSGNLRDATQFVGRTTHDTFRRVGIEATTRKYAAGATVRDMKKEVIRRLVDQGQTAMIDRAGRRWRLDSYAGMVARTTTREAASVATLNTCREFGLDLVQISQHYPTCPLCAPIQGKVYSISGEDKRYPRYTDEVRIPKHPNCLHSVHPYVRELDDNAADMERFSNQPAQPQSEAETQAYKDARDKVTIAANRKRAREVLLSENAPIEEKAKAARKLQKTYEKTGTRPVGKDASIIKQYKEFLKTGRYQGKIVLKGKNYSPAYREKLLELDGYFSLHGHQLNEHGLGKVLGRIEQGRISNRETVLELLESSVKFSELDGTLVKLSGGLSAHVDPKTNIVITVTPRKKPRKEWREVR